MSDREVIERELAESSPNAAPGQAQAASVGDDPHVQFCERLTLSTLRELARVRAEGADEDTLRPLLAKCRKAYGRLGEAYLRFYAVARAERERRDVDEAGECSNGVESRRQAGRDAERDAWVCTGCGGPVLRGSAKMRGGLCPSCWAEGGLSRLAGKCWGCGVSPDTAMRLSHRKLVHVVVGGEDRVSVLGLCDACVKDSGRVRLWDAESRGRERREREESEQWGDLWDEGDEGLVEWEIGDEENESIWDRAPHGWDAGLWSDDEPPDEYC